MEPRQSRQAKDHVFVDVFDQPKYCLEVFNALHPEVTDITEGKVLFETSVVVKADAATPVETIDCPDGKHFLYIEWFGDEVGNNHFVTDCIDLDFNSYLEAITKTGYINSLEGFSDYKLF